MTLRNYHILLILLTLSLDIQASELNSQCPPSFQKVENMCELVSLYDYYDSPEGHGGFRVNLPKLEKSYSPEQVDLGRLLFFDPALSGNKDVSCVSCHQLSKGLSDGLDRSLSGAGISDSDENEKLRRATPTLWNTAFLTRFMWDGRAETLSEQAKLPLFSPKEMSNTPKELEKTLAEIPEYVQHFKDVYNDLPKVEHVAESLAAFQTSLISLNSRYDRYVHGDESAMSAQEIRGYNVFRGFVARCSQCHIPPLFTDSELSVIGSPQPKGIQDSGAGESSDDPFLEGAFKVPTLRNITKTAPYFHAGQFESLSDVVSFYNNTRGHAAPKDLDLKIHWHIHMTSGPKLSSQDEKDIVAFLAALDDEQFLPRIPKKVPSGLPINK